MEGGEESQNLRETSSSRWDDTEDTSIFTELWKTGAWRLFPLMLIYVASLTTLSPVKPDIMTNFFASRANGSPLRCESFAMGHVPQVCKDAHAQVVQWSSWTDFFANSVLSFYFAPKVGIWSDMYGRKPFLLLAFGCAIIPMVVLLLNITIGVSLLFYFPASAINGAFSSIIISLAYVSDIVRPSLRGPTFGLIVASFSVGFLIGPAVGRVLPPITAAATGVAGVGLCMFLVLFLPETLSRMQKIQAHRRHARNQKAGKSGILAGVGILARSRLFIKLTACLMLTGMVAEGLYELLMQYFQLKLGFTQGDQGLLLEVAGVGGLLVQTVILRWSLHLLGPTRVLIMGLFGSVIQQVMLAYAPNKLFAFVAIGVGTLSNVGFPAISSIKANNVQDYEQGAIQGALYAAKSLAQGLGPITFAALFSLFSRSDSPLPYFPGAPFLFGAALSSIAIIIAVTIDAESADRGVQQLPEVNYEELDSDETRPLASASTPGSPERNEGSEDTQPSSPETPDSKKPALSGIAPAADSVPAPTTPEPWPGRTLNPTAAGASAPVSPGVDNASSTGVDNASSPGNAVDGRSPGVPPRVGNRVVWGPPKEVQGGGLAGDQGIYPDVAAPGVGRPSGDWARGRFVWPTRMQNPEPARS